MSISERVSISCTFTYLGTITEKSAVAFSLGGDNFEMVFRSEVMSLFKMNYSNGSSMHKKLCY